MFEYIVLYKIENFHPFKNSLELLLYSSKDTSILYKLSNKREETERKLENYAA